MIYKQASDLSNIVVAVFTILTFIATFLVPKGQTKTQTVKVPTESPKIFKVIRFIQSTTESTWGFLRNISIFVNIVILAYAVALLVGAVGALVVDKTNFFSYKMTLILIMLFVFPIFSLINDFTSELKLRRGERSRAFRWAEIEINANYDSLLIRCFQILTDMGARITHYNAGTGNVEAEFPNNYLVLDIRKLQDDRYAIYIASDSYLPSVRIDFGVNQRCVNECVTRLLGYR